MSGIYVIEGERLVALHEEAYDSEDLLQALLAKYPSLLAGDQMGSVPRRWILVSREAPLASEEGGGGRWSVDHLFVDQDAVPTVVEVKRSVDTRIRRAVVGQMLDYAANAVVYWPVDGCASYSKSSAGGTASFLTSSSPSSSASTAMRTNSGSGSERTCRRGACGSSLWPTSSRRSCAGSSSS